jgi:type I restriction enzyme S subunit
MTDIVGKLCGFCHTLRHDGIDYGDYIFCPIEAQLEVVRRIEAMFKLIDTVEKRVETAKARAEKLTQTILARAFRGELVPAEAELARREGRYYEPASVLLARIKSERDAKQASQKVRRNRN